MELIKLIEHNKRKKGCPKKDDLVSESHIIGKDISINNIKIANKVTNLLSRIWGKIKKQPSILLDYETDNGRRGYGDIIISTPIIQALAEKYHTQINIVLRQEAIRKL